MCVSDVSLRLSRYHLRIAPTPELQHKVLVTNPMRLCTGPKSFDLHPTLTRKGGAQSLPPFHLQAPGLGQR